MFFFIFMIFILNVFVDERDPKSSHTTHIHHGSFGVVKFCSLREVGRRGWEGRLMNGVRMKQMITFD